MVDPTFRDNTSNYGLFVAANLYTPSHPRATVTLQRGAPVRLSAWRVVRYMCVHIFAWPANRARFLTLLSKLVARGRERQAAAVAALVSQLPDGEALPAARERFRGLPLSDMRIFIGPMGDSMSPCMVPSMVSPWSLRSALIV